MHLSKSLITWTSVSIGIVFILFVLIIVNQTGKKISQSYFSKAPQPVKINDSETGTQTFTIKKISLQAEGSCQTLELTRNGEAKKIDCDDTYLDNRLFLTNDQIAKLFGKLTKEEFNNLSTKYFLEGLDKDLIITIETNFGTKEITLSSNDPEAPSVPDSLEEIVDETTDIEEEINNPTPSPTPGNNPTPTPGTSPTPISSALPSPTPASTPSPSTDPGATPEPFRCDMLDQQGVTVSNIRCLEE